MFASLAKPPVCGFADLLNTGKNIRKFQKKIPPVEAITLIAESGKGCLPVLLRERIDFTIIYDEKLKSRMAQASDTMFKSLAQKAKNDIDRAKLNAYSHYATFYIKAPVVIAVVCKNASEPDLSNMAEQMRLTAQECGAELFDLYPQLSAHKEFSDILELEKPAHVLTLFAVGYCE